MKIATAVLMLMVLAISSTYASQCFQTWQCTSSSENYNYVECIDGACQCKTDLGFTGSATFEDKCKCADPKQVYWKQGDPFCLSYEDAVTCQHEETREAILESKVRLIYDSLIWPVPQTIMGGLIYGDNSFMETLFAPNAAGRVDPVGSYSDFEGIVEYFYGTVWQGFAKVQSVDMRKIVAQGNEVASRVNILIGYYDQDDNLMFSANTTQTGIFTFNEDNLVEKTELIIHYLGKANAGQSAAEIIGAACHFIMNVAQCTSEHDPDGYYNDFNDCYAHLSGLNIGSWDDVPSDTAICRYYHSLLAIARPHQHCSHSGKTGGGKCIDTPYSDYYKKEY